MSMPRTLLVAAFATSWGFVLGCSGPSGPSGPNAPNAPNAPGAAGEPAVAETPASSALGGAEADGTIKRIYISLKRPSGTSVITRKGKQLTTAIEILENGRGPKVDATITLADDGTIAALQARGHHAFGATFESSFSLAGGQASWKSPEETGARALPGPAFYVPPATIPELDGLLVQAALRRGGPGGGTIDILPAGTARVEKTGEVQVSAGGTTRTLVGYSISGLKLSPSQTWMNRDGSWFGSVSEWGSLVPQGWEAAIEPLLAEQRRLTRERDARLAAELAHRPPAAGLAFTHARVLDVEKGRWLADQTVLVVGETIKAVGPSTTTKVPAGAEVVDLAGKALLPGLVDMHAHLGDEDGLLNLASGVTTARDVGNDPDKVDDFKKRYDEGAAIGPHVLRFGFIEGRNEKAASSTITAETVEEAQAAVKFFADRGYEGVKIYNSMRPELVPVIAKAAHQRGLLVTGHVPVHMLAHEAVRAGYDGIEHVNMLFLNFFATHDTDTRDTTRFTLVGDKAADFDLTSKPVRDFFKLLVERKTVIDPTNNAFEDLLVGEQGKIIPGLEDMVARLPVQAQRFYLLGGLPLDGDKRARYAASFDKTLAMTRALYDAKVRLVIGTDALAGLMYHHELELYARAGIPNAAILRMATIDPARYLGRAGGVGTVAAGKVADLIVVDGDPLARIADVKKVETTMRAGVVYSTAALYGALGVAPHGRR
jgi:imidazolonepropionase-like amidohydrolase